jgi:hypothetical protein
MDETNAKQALAIQHQSASLPFSASQCRMLVLNASTQGSTDEGIINSGAIKERLDRMLMLDARCPGNAVRNHRKIIWAIKAFSYNKLNPKRTALAKR